MKLWKYEISMLCLGCVLFSCHYHCLYEKVQTCKTGQIKTSKSDFPPLFHVLHKEQRSKVMSMVTLVILPCIIPVPWHRGRDTAQSFDCQYLATDPRRLKYLLHKIKCRLKSFWSKYRIQYGIFFAETPTYWFLFAHSSVLEMDTKWVSLNQVVPLLQHRCL